MELGNDHYLLVQGLCSMNEKNECFDRKEKRYDIRSSQLKEFCPVGRVAYGGQYAKIIVYMSRGSVYSTA